MRKLLYRACIAGALLLTATHLGAETFIESDDYEEGEGGIINAFLVDEDYAIMEEDLERHDTSFDWGWVRTATWARPAGEPQPEAKGLKKLFNRRGNRPKMGNTTSLAFDIRAARTIHVAPLQNLGGIMRDETTAEIQEAFRHAATALGLELVDDRESAALELGTAIVDQMREVANVPVYGIRVNPFVTMEVRLVDVATGEKLLLIRNRKHGGSVADAALNFADDLVKFLR